MIPLMLLDIYGDRDVRKKEREFGVLMNCAFAYIILCGHCLNSICKMSMFVWIVEMLE